MNNASCSFSVRIADGLLWIKTLTLPSPNHWLYYDICHRLESVASSIGLPGILAYNEITRPYINPNSAATNF